ncbi:hypothetical protein CLAM6_21290 [Cobetia sp. AM6]|nr:hypothetical protein CLAM6_21290 [Cobetia sp. AM6]
MPGNTSEAEYHASMLNGLVGVIELGTNAANITTADLGYHLAQPLAIDRFDIVIDQTNYVTAGFTGTIIIDSRVIEGMVPWQYTYT